jgi:tagaturonate reductase
LVIDCIDRCINPYEDYAEYLALAEIPTLRYVISNTTEAGICYREEDKLCDTPPISFPAKVTALLYRRWQAGLDGFVFLPCELIDRNGDKLRECVLRYAADWGLEEEFVGFVKKNNVFTSTLVDRINTGFPKGETGDLGFSDKMLNASEFFHLWVIETDYPLERELRFTEAGLNVIVTPDGLEKYRTRKVRILNGAHTSAVAHGLLSGLETVGDLMKDEKMREHIEGCIFDEIIPTLDMDKEELTGYARGVLTRFMNPYIEHRLRSIALNSVSKFKVRVLPSILEYHRLFGRYPTRLCYSLKRLIELYRIDPPKDDPEVIEKMRTLPLHDLLSDKNLWGEDISRLMCEVEK